MADNTTSGKIQPQAQTAPVKDEKQEAVKTGRPDDKICPGLPFSYLRRALRNKVGKHE
ncbi:hypothetical protein L9H26_05565 [Morganella psychrotolerans]|uniref:hypothetical protein n=1 Tax=Morganella psychrotolerans TaxID=368603 RepID=UPI000AF87DBF|nr:hypothetical protein [Morganella psychrotolerans]